MRVQQPQRRGKPRGSQTARVDSSHAVSETRKEMAEAKSSVQVRCHLPAAGDAVRDTFF